MKKLFVGLAAVCVLAGGAFAAGGDPSESGISTSPLKIWSTGVGGGLLYSCKGDGGIQTTTYGKVMWLNSFDFTEGVALFADVDWYIGNDLLNFGLDLGGDYSFLPFSRVSPFLGAGFGAHYFDIKVVEDFGDTEMRGDFGGAVIVRAGVTLKLTNTVDVKVRVPFRYYLMNDYRDFGVGMEIGVLFFSRLRGVKSIDY
jgi:hypothetical protein